MDHSFVELGYSTGCLDAFRRTGLSRPHPPPLTVEHTPRPPVLPHHPSLSSPHPPTALLKKVIAVRDEMRAQPVPPTIEELGIKGVRQVVEMEDDEVSDEIELMFLQIAGPHELKLLRGLLCACVQREHAPPLD